MIQLLGSYINPCSKADTATVTGFWSILFPWNGVWKDKRDILGRWRTDAGKVHVGQMRSGKLDLTEIRSDFVRLLNPTSALESTSSPPGVLLSLSSRWTWVSLIWFSGLLFIPVLLAETLHMQACETHSACYFDNHCNDVTLHRGRLKIRNK